LKNIFIDKSIKICAIAKKSQVHAMEAQNINPNTLTPEPPKKVCPNAPHKPNNMGYKNVPTKTFRKLEPAFKLEPFFNEEI
jgi:hypothetical protein